MLEIETKLGDIRFSRNVIIRIIEDAVESCDGKVTILNYKGKYKSVMPGNGIVFTQIEEGVEITVYVVIAFGAGIKKYSNRIIDYIYDTVEKVMGERPLSVKVIVTGVQSKEIARRHIEVGKAE